MAKKLSPTLVGGFVLGAIALAVAGIAYFGKGTFLEKTNKYVLFFDGSLNGLHIGAPVLARGVKIGEVTNIVVRYHEVENEIDIPVYIRTHPEQIERIGGAGAPTTATMQMLIHQGLRAQLQTQSFVTGLLAVQLDFFPGTEPRYKSSDLRFMEIPTVPSSLEEITKTLKDLPIEDLVKDLRSAVQGVDELVRSEELRHAIRTLDTTLEDYGKLARDVNAKVEPITASLDAALTQARDTLKTAEEKISSVEHSLTETLAEYRTLARNADQALGPAVQSFREAVGSAQIAFDQARGTLISVQGTVSADSVLSVRIFAALQELTDAARSIRVLAEMLDQQPEAVLRGKRPDGE